jgi:hypothetical protein
MYEDNQSNIHYDSIVEFNLSHGCMGSVNNLNFLQLNARNIRNGDEMEYLRLFLDIVELDLDFMIIGETWLKPDLVDLFHLNGYFGEFSSRSNRIGGGIAEFVSKRHCYYRFDILGNITEDISCVSLNISINCDNSKILVLHSVYLLSWC